MSARVFFLLATVVTLALANTFSQDSMIYSQFEEFITKYDKKYANDIEKAMRFGIYLKGLDFIDHLNKRSKKAKFGITKFADLTREELLKWNGYRKPRDDIDTCKEIKDADNIDVVSPTDKEFDWRKKGAVSRVKNQGNCGSCWAFSAIGNMEGVHAIKTGKMVELSAQQLIDCDDESMGCHGGYMSYALSYLKTQGAMSDDDYPYLENQVWCRYNESKVVVTPKDCYVLKLSEDAYAQKLREMGPLSIGIDGAILGGFYFGGILTDDDCTNNFAINHGVLLVGYGEEDGIKYWIVKNSWGADWGEDGYFRMERGVNCLLMTEMTATAVL